MGGGTLRGRCIIGEEPEYNRAEPIRCAGVVTVGHDIRPEQVWSGFRHIVAESAAIQSGIIFPSGNTVDCDLGGNL